MGRTPLGELLREMNLITEAQLNTALAVHARARCRLGRALTGLRLVREEQLVPALTRQLGLRFVRLDHRVIAPEVLRRLPVKVMQRFNVIPVALRSAAGPLVVATSEPQNLEVLDALRFAAGMRVEPVVAGEQQISLALARHGIAGRRLPDPLDVPDADGEMELIPRFAV